MWKLFICTFIQYFCLEQRWKSLSAFSRNWVRTPEPELGHQDQVWLPGSQQAVLTCGSHWGPDLVSCWRSDTIQPAQSYLSSTSLLKLFQTLRLLSNSSFRFIIYYLFDKFSGSCRASSVLVSAAGMKLIDLAMWLLFSVTRCWNTCGTTPRLGNWKTVGCNWTCQNKNPAAGKHSSSLLSREIRDT